MENIRRPRMEVLGNKPPGDDLARFATWYLSGKPNLPMRPPAGKVVHFVDGVHTKAQSLVIWREGRFQVEQVACEPGLVIPPHSHPNVDSFEVHLNGGVDFVIEGRRPIPRSLLGKRDWYGMAVRVRPGVVHWAETGPEGGAFLSIQEWPEGIEMSAVGHDWREASAIDWKSSAFVPLTAELLQRFYGHPPAHTTRGVALVVDGEPIYVIGLYYEAERMVLFSDTKPEVRALEKTGEMKRLVVHGLRQVAELMHSLNAPVYAVAERGEGSVRLLTRLGFKRGPRNVFIWEGT